MYVIQRAGQFLFNKQNGLVLVLNSNFDQTMLAVQHLKT